MKSTVTPLNDCIDLLAERLPPRALHHICRALAAEARRLVKHQGLTDNTVHERLTEVGVRTVVVTRQAVNDILATKKISETDVHLFEKIDPALRGNRNPFVPLVRGLVESALAAG